MSDKPILFSAPMVRALLAGTKTQTRRVLKPQPLEVYQRHGDWWASYAAGAETPLVTRIEAGDRLWVRETVRAVNDENMFGHQVEYLADGTRRTVAEYGDISSDSFGDWWTLLAYRSDDPDLTGGKKVPPIHMPRWASRITLRVMDIRIERLQDISEADARAEGVLPLPSGRFHCGYDDEGEVTSKSAITAYAWLWDRINGAGAWGANPWVTAFTVETTFRNIDNGDANHG